MTAGGGHVPAIRPRGSGQVAGRLAGAQSRLTARSAERLLRYPLVARATTSIRLVCRKKAVFRARGAGRARTRGGRALVEPRAERPLDAGLGGAPPHLLAAAKQLLEDRPPLLPRHYGEPLAVRLVVDPRLARLVMGAQRPRQQGRQLARGYVALEPSSSSASSTSWTGDPRSLRRFIARLLGVVCGGGGDGHTYVFVPLWRSSTAPRSQLVGVEDPIRYECWPAAEGARRTSPSPFPVAQSANPRADAGGHRRTRDGQSTALPGRSDQSSRRRER